MAKRKNKFKKNLLVYLGILFILCMAFIVYIYFTLVNYEANQTGNFLKTSIKQLDDDTLKGYLKDSNKDESLLNDYKRIIKSNDIKFTKTSENTFEATLNERLLFTVETKVVATKTKLAFFSYEEREVLNIIPNLERGLIYYDITVPNNFTIYLDNLEYVGDFKEEASYIDLDFMYINDSMPKMVTYEINDLTDEKKVTVTDFLGTEIKLKQDDYKYYIPEYYINVDNFDDFENYIPDMLDISEVAHNWSLFMSKDLKGTYYGLSTINNYLISGTNIYQMAYDWAHSIDITFTSRHTLKNPIFTDEVINNFKIYSESAFSCDVAFTKNMIVNGKDQPDKMHDTLYFIKDSTGAWKLINIKSVEA